jgi:hypothetical protein
LSVHEGLTTLVVGSLAIESTFLKEPLAAAS